MLKSNIRYRNLGVWCALIFILLLFIAEKQVTNEDIKSKNEFIYKTSENKNDGNKIEGKRLYWIEFQFMNDTCKYSISRVDYRCFELKNFLKEVNPNDTLIVEHTGNIIYHLSKKGGKEYTNLIEANNKRKKDFIWAAAFALISSLYCLFNAYYARASTDGVFFIVWFIILLMAACLLSLIFGSIF
jgi:hypothetical protein